ncbi:MAG: acetyl-lysine deacetylase, partial [Chloroflexi bacterium]|nr:acetyl-lysine deacetylase [Chloroflexota bacterium]
MTVSDDAAVELLAAMLRAPSLCGQEDAVADVLLNAMREIGFQAQRDQVGNVIGSIGPN